MPRTRRSASARQKLTGISTNSTGLVVSRRHPRLLHRPSARPAGRTARASDSNRARPVSAKDQMQTCGHYHVVRCHPPVDLPPRPVACCAFRDWASAICRSCRRDRCPRGVQTTSLNVTASEVDHSIGIAWAVAGGVSNRSTSSPPPGVLLLSSNRSAESSAPASLPRSDRAAPVNSTPRRTSEQHRAVLCSHTLAWLCPVLCFTTDRRKILPFDQPTPPASRHG
jgi:hypothetical protein